MHLIILDLLHPDDRLARHGTIGAMIRDWLAPHLPEATITMLDISGGTPLPALGDADGFIVSGSEKGVYDDTPWMGPLRAWLLAAKDAGKPLFGICFGHQVMADTFGGKAEKAKAGFVVGAMTYNVGGRAVTAHALHQDQVTRVPPGATVTASAPICPIAALSYDFPAASVQFHPEFSAEMVRDTAEVVLGDRLTPERAEAARESLTAHAVSRDVWAAEAQAFFRAHIGARTAA